MFPGHASKEELKLMLSLIKPKYFIPVHGEYRHLVYHSQLARKVNIPEENIFILEDGEVMEFTRKQRAARGRGERRQGVHRRQDRGLHGGRGRGHGRAPGPDEAGP